MRKATALAIGSSSSNVRALPETRQRKPGQPCDSVATMSAARTCSSAGREYAVR